VRFEKRGLCLRRQAQARDRRPRADIRPGEKIGLVGRSGAGKSTVVNLLLRFYDVQEGRILIDGQDIAGVTQDSLRRQVGMVTQDTSLLHRSVRDNIVYGRPDATEAEMRRAAERAEAHDFIAGLADPKGRKGYDAHVGERGVKLSGGQRQRIAIARVMLKDAPILLLDEATSALDSEVEAAIQASLYRLMEGKTVVAIAHRLSTIAAMDRLVVMDRAASSRRATTELLAPAASMRGCGRTRAAASWARRALTAYRPFWAKRFGPAPFLPMSRAEMDRWAGTAATSIIVTGDAYVDHPSFGMAVIGRTLEAQGFRVGIIAQPDWQSAEPFKALGKPNLFFGVAAGNMDSMINRYTADRKIRSDDAYTPGGAGGKRPDRATLVYTQRCKEAWKRGAGGHRRHRGQPAPHRALRLLAGQGAPQHPGRQQGRPAAVRQRRARHRRGRAPAGARASPSSDHRRARHRLHAPHRRPERRGWFELDSTEVDRPGRIDEHINPYLTTSEAAAEPGADLRQGRGRAAGPPAQAVVAMPASRARPARGAAAARAHGDPPAQLRAGEERPGALRPRQPRAAPGNQPRQRPRAGAAPWRPRRLDQPAAHPADHGRDGPRVRPALRPQPAPGYADETGGHDGPTKIPAWEMIRFSVNIMRGCFGGCTFCSITEHEGRIIQSRSEDSIIREIEEIRDKVKGFTGVISDLGGPHGQHVAHRLQEPEIEAACRKPSCVYPGICPNLNTDHGPLIKLYRRARRCAA
jgi:ABC-type polar amino acid transport system ATPase subunit